MKIGVLGGGQLGKMLAESGVPLGHDFVFVDANPTACAAPFGTHIVGSMDNTELLQAFAEQCDVVTYESENTPVDCATFIEQFAPVYPTKKALEVTQDRLHEKTFCNELSIPTAKFLSVENVEGLQTATEEIGFPCILKTRRMGYDGKGQVFMKSDADRPAAQQLVENQPCILEQCVSFEREVSIIATRSQEGEIVYYPLTENAHKEGILHTSRAPCNALAETEQQAHAIAAKMLEEFEYVGTLAIELFEMADGQLLVNEMAPRVHNSGHWTIEGAQTSQFENHVRAICGMPLGSTEPIGFSAMVNIIGTYPSKEELEKLEGVHVHFYGKEERPKRKIGHVTIRHDEADTVQQVMEQVIDIVLS